ncbi:MAG: hypothetical protein KJO30_11045 [Boseongicola sp.]|nr:hypothetical protein [Boseongicola sp.]
MKTNKALWREPKKNVFCARGKSAALTALTSLILALPNAAHAQSFFASNVTDPAAGVDRGSTSNIRKLDEPTTFLTFDTYGSTEVGPNILGLGHVSPDLFLNNDQLDVVGVIAGPSDDDDLELTAGGIGYRFSISESLLGFANFTQSDVTLGSPETIALNITGTLRVGALGLRHTSKRENEAQLTSTVELIGRHSDGTLLGMPSIDEDLRLLRASVLYQQGLPNLFQRRFAAAVTKGLDALGASEPGNPLASTPGATSDFLRASFSTEVSLPLSDMWVANAGLVGQWSGDSLPVSQRCGYGTNAYARGFDQTYVSADQCLGSRVELAYNVQPPSQDDKGIVFTQAYAGIDFGRFWNNTNSILPSRADDWSSASLGLRTIQGDYIGEISITHIFDQPTGPAPQEQTRLWIRSGIRF